MLTRGYVFTYETYFFSQTPVHSHRQLSTGFLNVIVLSSFYFSAVLKSRPHLGLMCEAKGIVFFCLFFHQHNFPPFLGFFFLVPLIFMWGFFFWLLISSCTHFFFPFSSLPLTFFVHTAPLLPVYTSLFLLSFPHLCLFSLHSWYNWENNIVRTWGGGSLLMTVKFHYICSQAGNINVVQCHWPFFWGEDI